MICKVDSVKPGSGLVKFLVNFGFSKTNCTCPQIESTFHPVVRDHLGNLSL